MLRAFKRKRTREFIRVQKLDQTGKFWQKHSGRGGFARAICSAQNYDLFHQ